MQNKDSEKELVEVLEKLHELALNIPDFPLEDVPEGLGAQDNVVLKEVLARPEFLFPPRDHVELGQLTNTIDFARAAKMSGSRFAFLRGLGSRLNRALLQFFL